MPVWHCGGPCSRRRHRRQRRRNRQVSRGWSCCQPCRVLAERRCRVQRRRPDRRRRRRVSRLHRPHQPHQHQRLYPQRYPPPPRRQLSVHPRPRRHRRHQPPLSQRKRRMLQPSRRQPQKLLQCGPMALLLRRQNRRQPHHRLHRSAAPAWGHSLHAPMPMRRWRACVGRPVAPACARTRTLASARFG